MKMLPFKPSHDFSIGIELEYQIINPHSWNLISRAKELIRSIQKSDSKLSELVKPEITTSMLEINSSIHTSANELYQELRSIRSFLIEQSDQVNVLFCGGGTHPFQKWVERKIFPTHRYRNLSRRYQYLSKQATVFGQHIHIGCSSPEHAIYLTHILARYVPQLIAMSASSPFYQGADTGYYSARSTLFSNFPLSGTIPLFRNWKQFSSYFNKLRKLGIVESMKDFYWDIRPKPEFGTVEIRVCDTPLTIKKAVMLGAYVQALSYYLLRDKPYPISADEYILYNYNRFQGARYGLEGHVIDPYTFEKCFIIDDILETMEKIKPAAQYLGTTKFLSDLKNDIVNKTNDAKLLREFFDQAENLKEVVSKQCKLWIS